LSEAILVNPADKREIADALNRALVLSVREREVLVSRMQIRLRRYTVFSWADDIIRSAEEIKKEQESRKVNLITSGIESQIVKEFSSAARRAIFLDYDGTLVPFSRIPELATPSAATVDQLKRLSLAPANTVVIISGRDKDFLNEWFGAVNVHCIAEHGAFQKAPGGQWQCTIDPDQSWKTEIMPVLQKYMDRCNGSFIEEKFSSLSWHYRNSPYEIASLRSKELTEELRAAVAHENKLHVLEGNKVVEVKKAGYDKGVAAAKFVSDNAFDFVMAMGDDRTDEDVFRSLPAEAVTIKVGIKTTRAKYNIRSQGDVARFVGRLVENSRP